MASLQSILVTATSSSSPKLLAPPPPLPAGRFRPSFPTCRLVYDGLSSRSTSILAADRDECRSNLWKLRTEVSLQHNHLNHILTLHKDIVTIDGQVPLDWC